MGGGGRNRRNQDMWNAATQQQLQTAQQQNAAIAQVDPLEQAWRDRQKAVLDWDKKPGKDIRDLPGMSEHIQIGEAAVRRANQDRMGTGALQLGADGASGYAQKMKELRQAQMGEEVGAGLDNARAQIHAEAANSIMPLAQLHTNRKLGQAQHSLGIANTSAGMFGQWNQRRSKNWWDYLREGIGMGGMLFGGGGS